MCKLGIRYLLNGSMIIDEPVGFKDMTKEEKLDYASEELASMSDSKIYLSTATIDNGDSMYDGDDLVVEAIEDLSDYSVIAQTELWKAYHNETDYNKLKKEYDKLLALNMRLTEKLVTKSNVGFLESNEWTV